MKKLLAIGVLIAVGFNQTGCKTQQVGLFGINTVNGKTQYTPPCSQGPGAKVYVMTVYALSAAPVFSVPQTAVTRDILLAAISKTTLATSALKVSYTRP